MSTVVMTHPDLPGDESAVTTQEAFNEVWSDKGWELVDAEPAPKHNAPKPPPAAQAPLTVNTKPGV